MIGTEVHIQKHKTEQKLSITQPHPFWIQTQQRGVMELEEFLVYAQRERERESYWWLIIYSSTFQVQGSKKLQYIVVLGQNGAESVP